MPEAPPSSPARATPSERSIARVLEGVSAGPVPSQILARLENRRVCLNVVAPREPDAAWLPFSTAAEKRGRVTGDRLLPLVASGRLEGTFFVAFEVGYAVPLPTHRAVAKMTTAHCLKLLSGAGRALDHAVASGCFPVEVTPDSVFVDRNRGAYLADLGVAREALGNPPAERDEHAPWIAPEILSGGEPVERSAVYSFGALMYTLLTGAPPHAGSPEEIAVAEPPSLREARPDLPEALELVVATAMARDPRRRYRTTSEARSLAQVVLQGELQPLSTPTRAARFPRGPATPEPEVADRATAIRQEAEVGRKEQREHERKVERERARLAKRERKEARAAYREHERRTKDKRTAQARAERGAERARRRELRAARAEGRQALGAAALRNVRERGTWLGRTGAATVQGLLRRRAESLEALEERQGEVRRRRGAVLQALRERSAHARARVAATRAARARAISARTSLGARAGLEAGRLRSAAPYLPLALIAGALTLGALAGALLGGSRDDEPATPGRLSGGGLAVRLPADWEGGASGPGALEAHPADDLRSGLTLELEDAPVESEEQAKAVRLGRLEAWRERAADGPGARASVRYVVPTETGKLVATCRASAAAAPGTLALCERAASTLRLRSATGLPLAAVVEQQQRRQAALARLAGERARARRSLAGASRPAGQRLAAEALARVNERGARRFAALPGGEAVAAAARRTAAAYTALARSAGDDSARRWNAARERVRRAEAALRSALASS